MPASSVTIGIPVRELDEATRWYTEVLGKPPDIEPVPDIREWNIAGTWIQLAEDPRTGGNWVLRIGVADLDAERPGRQPPQLLLRTG
jgi:catechol 2,3-dioxygenase-like lactoylglutathione lyase family enzyme